jgi:hypothetical protein
MPVSVAIDFTPSERPDEAVLQIYEAPDPSGPWTMIDTVVQPAVGVYPNYISRYTTALATSLTDWFAIQWVDSKGAVTGLSDGVQGGTTTLISEIVSRMMLRDAAINENVAVEEAAAIVEWLYPNVDPFTVLRTAATLRRISGMAMLAMARIYILPGSSSASSWTAGLVSMKSSTSTVDRMKQIEFLAREAAKLLGMGYSVIAQAVLPEINQGFSEIVSADISRLQIEVE